MFDLPSIYQFERKLGFWITLGLCHFCLIFLKLYVVKNTSPNVFLKHNCKPLHDREQVHSKAGFRGLCLSV